MYVQSNFSTRLLSSNSITIYFTQRVVEYAVVKQTEHLLVFSQFNSQQHRPNYNCKTYDSWLFANDKHTYPLRLVFWGTPSMDAPSIFKRASINTPARADIKPPRRWIRLPCSVSDLGMVWTCLFHKGFHQPKKPFFACQGVGKKTGAGACGPPPGHIRRWHCLFTFPPPSSLISSSSPKLSMTFSFLPLKQRVDETALGSFEISLRQWAPPDRYLYDWQRSCHTISEALF